jgi:hypothetical protein
MIRPRQNFHCNFRAPNKKWFQVWLELKEATKTMGLDICFVVLTLCRAWLKALKEGNSSCQLETKSQMIFLCQANTFNYNVQKPRRERFQRDCSKNLPKCTLCSKAFQAYIIDKVRDLNRSFSFKDFLEINHDLFRKLILELRNRHKILPLTPRTNPEFYILAEWKPRYPSMNGNNTVKPKFTDQPDQKGDS